MPTYQYACTACGHQLEAVQSFSDEPLTVCPECAGRLRKVFNSVGIVFKGSGFYRTDSRANGKAEKSDSKPTADSGSTSDSSTPSTSQSKSDSKPSSTGSSSSSSKAAPAAA